METKAGGEHHDPVFVFTIINGVLLLTYAFIGFVCGGRRRNLKCVNLNSILLFLVFVDECSVDTSDFHSGQCSITGMPYLVQD